MAKAVEADFFNSTQPRERIYVMYVADVSWPIGILKVTSGIDEYGHAWINVLAELDQDKGRNNTVAVGDITAENIMYAIGFTCGSAFWRDPTYVKR